jgi:NitT/TauT family transport system ATP-binding protein
MSALPVPPQLPADPQAQPSIGAPVIVLDGVGKRYLTRSGEYCAFESLDLTIREGEFVCVLGPSGCGKTTLLRILAGLDRHTSGTLRMPPEQGRMPLTSVVFQENSIFPWLTVRDNVAFGLRALGAPRDVVQERTDRLIETVGLSNFRDSYPYQLSGGMKQRVSIARAFATDPSILLMDEPFSALDEQNRTILQEELLRVWESTRKTVVFVTHSIDEALFLGDRVVVMGSRPGRVLADLPVPFARPRSPYALKATSVHSELMTRIASLIREGTLASRA